MRLIAIHRLADFDLGRDNNFNLIRLVAALSVFVSHTPLFTGGMDSVSREMWLLGRVSVWTFFAISGYLIAASFLRSQTVGAFAVARCLRIFPALAACILMTVFVVGPASTNLPTVEYLTSIETYRFIVGNMMLLGEPQELPGVFASHPEPMVQVTFWTLKYEAICYAGVAVIGTIGTLQSKSRLALFSVVTFILVGLVLTVNDMQPGYLPEPVVYMAQFTIPFLLGVLAFAFRRFVYLNVFVFAALAGATWLLWWTPAFHALLPLTIAYGALWAAYVPSGAIRAFNGIGDYSYGIYIFGVPFQQLAISALGQQTAASNFIFAILPTIFLAVLSWHFLEKPMLGLKTRFAGWSSARVPANSQT